MQLDSLRLEEEETARQAAQFFADFDRRVAIEAELVRGVRADLVVGDIPPPACTAAKRAGVPLLAIANFTWDWIYSIYSAFDRIAPDVIPVSGGRSASGLRRAFR